MSFAEPSWTLEIPGLAFRLMLEVHQRDELPYPLQYQPVAKYTSYFRQCEDAAVWVESNMDEALWNALDVLLQPQLRIQSLLFTGRQQERRHEFHAAIRGSTATVVAQQHDRPGTMMLTSCGRPEALVRTVAFLPETPAGRRPPLRIYRSELSGQPDSWLRQDNPVYQVEDMFHRPRDAWGEIGVFPGPAYDSRRTDDGLSLLWCDYPDDGRYYVENGSDIAAEPASQQQLHDRIAKYVSGVEHATAPA